MLRRLFPRMVILTSLGLLAVAVTSATAAAQEPFTFTANFTEVTHSPGEDVRIDLTLVNNTDAPLDLLLDIPVSPGDPWSPEIRGRIGSFAVNRATIAPDPTGESPTLLRLSNRIPDEADPGDYRFTLRARTPDGRFEQTIPIVYTVRSAAEAGEDLEVETRFPLLQGPADAAFEFAVTLRNRASEDVTVDLGGSVPEGWTMAFKPSFEDKFFTSISIIAGGSQSLDVLVTPPGNAEPGQYPVLFNASAGARAATANFGIILTGKSEVRLGTSSGRLNAEASAGSATAVPVVVFNTGSIPLAQISLIGQAPAGWDVSFDDPLVAGIEAGQFREVKANVTPAEDALPGDYSVTVFANSPETNDVMELRVTVTGSAFWGWIGLAIVAVVALGLIGLFLKLGRR